MLKGLLGLALYQTHEEYNSSKNIPLKKYGLKSETEENKVPKKRSWKCYGSMDNFNFYDKHVKEMHFNKKSWTKRYGTYTPKEVKKFYQEIKNGFLKPRDTPLKKMNKILLWINFLHSKSTIPEFCEKWNVKEGSVKNYVLDVLIAILISYYDDYGIIGVPNKNQQHIMNKILHNTNSDLKNAILYLDGTHKLTVGRNDVNKRSWKFHWRAAYSHLFVVDRIFGVIVAANVGNPSRKHDCTILKESTFGINFDQMLTELYYCLGDNAYYNFKKEQFAAMPKKTSHMYHFLDKNFMYKHKKCRVTVEHTFAKFFINQHTRLNEWTFKGPKALALLNCNLICAIILWNQARIWKLEEICS